MSIFKGKFRIFNGLLRHLSCNDYSRSAMSSNRLSPETTSVRNLTSPSSNLSDSSHGKNLAALLLHENVGFLDVIPIGLEFLNLTMTNAGDEQISISVERINAFIKADALKRKLFGQAIFNISKARDQNETISFCENILKCSKPLLLVELRKSNESLHDWSDKWLETFQVPDNNIGLIDAPGSSLKRHFDDMALSLAVSDSWLLNVRKAKESLYKLLRPQVVRVGL